MIGLGTTGYSNYQNGIGFATDSENPNNKLWF